MKRKTKTKNKKSQAKPKRLWHKRYDPIALGLILLVLVASESALAFNTTPADWHGGLSVLDMSPAVSSTVADMNALFEPMKFAASSVNEFYAQSAVATAQIFDTTKVNSQISPLAFVYGVNNFYQMAADQMASILDLTNYTSHTWSPQVAGASVYRLK